MSALKKKDWCVSITSDGEMRFRFIYSTTMKFIACFYLSPRKQRITNVSSRCLFFRCQYLLWNIAIHVVFYRRVEIWARACGMPKVHHFYISFFRILNGVIRVHLLYHIERALCSSNYIVIFANKFARWNFNKKKMKKHKWIIRRGLKR